MKAIAVFCSSSNQLPETMYQLAHATGQTLARHQLTTVYGGTDLGMMGQLAQGAYSASGHVIGVVPQVLSHVATTDPRCQLITTPGMSERKATIAQHADAFWVLPGGMGTLDEMTEVITQRYVKQHHKPIIIIDPHNTFAPIWQWLAQSQTLGLNPYWMNELFRTCQTPQEAIQLTFSQYHASQKP